MKLAGIIGTAVLSLTLGAAAPVYAQEEHPQQEEHGQQEEKKAQPEKPAQEQKQAQLYTDNVYVDYVDGGYFLYNPFHPGIRVVIIVI